MPPEFWQGIEQFNQAEFYACHDTLEALWMEADQSNKRFYQGILQIAVGCYHLSNQNLRGAAILLGEGMQKLRGYASDYGSIDVDHLLLQSHQLWMQVQQTTPDQVPELLHQLQAADSLSVAAFPKIRLVGIAPADLG